MGSFAESLRSLVMRWIDLNEPLDDMIHAIAAELEHLSPADYERTVRDICERKPQGGVDER